LWPFKYKEEEGEEEKFEVRLEGINQSVQGSFFFSSLQACTENRDLPEGRHPLETIVQASGASEVCLQGCSVG